ncbi:MAG: Mur ligase domain-containing protein, partial [Paraglaciecola polaris]
MIPVSLAWIAQQVKGELICNDNSIAENAIIQGVSTDTRQISSNDLFIALHGPNFDGHQFITQAQASGATAVIVNRKVDTTLAQIVVQDSKVAL